LMGFADSRSPRFVPCLLAGDPNKNRPVRAEAEDKIVFFGDEVPSFCLFRFRPNKKRPNRNTILVGLIPCIPLGREVVDIFPGGRRLDEWVRSTYSPATRIRSKRILASPTMSSSGAWIFSCSASYGSITRKTVVRVNT
jgi:hypothetical protein